MNKNKFSFCPFLINRIKQELFLKIFFSLLVNILFFIGYPSLQRNVIFPVCIVPELSIDRLIPFNPHFIWIYLSLNIQIPIIFWLMTHKTHLKEYGKGMVGMMGIAFFIFFRWPTEGPQIPPLPSHWAYDSFNKFILSFNAFPSLHIAFTLYSVLCLEFYIHTLPKPYLWRFLLWLWTLLIIYSTLTLKQHFIIDVFGGVMLALTIYTYTLKQTKKEF